MSKQRYGEYEFSWHGKQVGDYKIRIGDMVLTREFIIDQGVDKLIRFIIKNHIKPSLERQVKEAYRRAKELPLL